uniref:Uncharacterized protein n=1 Tax=Marseillevirus LCMAC102 TaxID=2506603 RepID=A0A481YSV5_9VIRU|nr:MAG: hypothetical protein LCMAC102_01030 [Marseillevirus LCMAC102]
MNVEPMDFWFNKTVADIGLPNMIAIFPEIDELRQLQANTTKDLKQLKRISKLLFELQRLCCRGAVQLPNIYPRIFSQEIEDVNNKIKKLSKTNFYDQLIMNKEEEFNGYKLYDMITPVIHEYKFKKWLSAWNDTTNITKENFLKIYDKTADNDWGKMDEHGIDYGGYWRYPQDSYEYKNAYDLSRKKNGECLWNLPYPKKFVLKTIDAGPIENVRYSNFLCEWMKRKIKQMNPNTLKSILIRHIENNGIDFENANIPIDLKEEMSKLH